MKKKKKQEEIYIHASASAVSRKSSACSYNAMTGNYQGNRILSYEEKEMRKRKCSSKEKKKKNLFAHTASAAHCSSRILVIDFLRKFGIRNNSTKFYLPDSFPHCYLKWSA